MLIFALSDTLYVSVCMLIKTCACLTCVNSQAVLLPYPTPF